MNWETHKAVGIRYTDTGNVAWVDENGDFISVDFDKQPSWCNIRDEGDKIFVPRFYFKTSNEPAAVWISSKRLRGFRLHRVFSYKSSEDGFRIMKEPQSQTSETISTLPKRYLNQNYLAEKAVYLLATMEYKLTDLLKALEMGFNPNVGLLRWI